jgi:S-adenosylmethionine hydrolase
MGNKNIITLITDFGDESGYAGVMKGVILTINPECQIIDITHRVSPQDIEEAAFLLNNAYPYFPAHTIHVVVVDPGVGSERKPILVETDKYWFVGPDNGVFSFVFSTKEIKSVWEITNTDYFFSEVSSTFHGRDIFAPVAGYLSLGVSAGKIGNELQKYVVLAALEPKVSEGAIKGRVVYVDRFGNLISNISKGLFNRWIADNPFELTVGKRVLHRLSRSYADAGEAEILALFGSSRWLEISVKNGNCQKELGLNKGAEVTIHRT